MKVRFTKTAEKEIYDILGRIAKENVTAAQEVSEAIENTIRAIQNHPRMALIVHPIEVRAVNVRGYGYRIFYAIGSEVLSIRNVRMMRQQRPWEA